MEYFDPRGGSNRYRIKTDFFQKWSKKMAYVLGFLYADGAIEDSKTSSRTQYITFASKNKDILETIKRTLKSEHPIHYRPPHKVLYGNDKTYESAESYHLRIGSKRMYADLLEVGLLPNKSKIIRFPDDIPDKYLGHFVRGYFDGDGCVHLKKGRDKKRDIILRGLNVIFTSGSKSFLEGLSARINKFIKPNQNKICDGHRAYQLRYSTSDSIKWFKFLYKNTPKGLYLKRKFEIFIKYFQLRPLKIDKEIIKMLDKHKIWPSTQEVRERSAKAPTWVQIPPRPQI